MRAPLAPIPSPARPASLRPARSQFAATRRSGCPRAVTNIFFTIATSARTTFSNAQNNKDGSVEPDDGDSRVPHGKIDRRSGNHANKTYKWKLYVHHEQARSTPRSGGQVHRLFLPRVSTVSFIILSAMCWQADALRAHSVDCRTVRVTVTVVWRFSQRANYRAGKSVKVPWQRGRLQPDKPLRLTSAPPIELRCLYVCIDPLH